ncbi:MAG: hypothetical protein U9Q22_05990 [Candidatus Altiarchaeota archaeon]|nr:hypothetical protein [Candidatus Altiarchaeota archaeon]
MTIFAIKWRVPPIAPSGHAHESRFRITREDFLKVVFLQGVSPNPPTSIPGKREEINKKKPMLFLSHHSHDLNEENDERE